MTANDRGVPFEPDEETARQMAGLAAQFVERARPLDASCNYSDESIAAAEQIGLRLRESLTRGLALAELAEARDDLAFQLGAYFGETLIRNHGGAWGWVTMGPERVFGLRTASGLMTFPMARATKRLAGDEDKSLVALYQLLVDRPGASN